MGGAKVKLTDHFMLINSSTILFKENIPSWLKETIESITGKSHCDYGDWPAIICYDVCNLIDSGIIDSKDDFHLFLKNTQFYTGFKLFLWAAQNYDKEYFIEAEKDIERSNPVFMNPGEHLAYIQKAIIKNIFNRILFELNKSMELY